MNRWHNPVRLVQGPNALEALPGLVAEAVPGGERVLLVVWGEGALAHPAFEALRRDLGERLETLVFPHSNPTLAQLFEAHAALRGKGIGLVVAVGGGSTLDIGKCLARLMGEDIADTDALRERVTSKDWGAPQCRWIGVPTTAGTGSEVTCWATVWDPERESKRSLDTPTNYAFAAVADPALTRTMPVGLSVSSALDAVAHATESYWAKSTNAESRALALAAIGRIMGAIDGLFDEDEARREAAREAMSEGATLAGLAFSNTHTTACHSLSYPLTLRYGIPHGVAVALLLAPVTRLNAAACDVTPLLRAFGADAPEDMATRVRGLLRRAGLHSHLRTWGAAEQDLPGLAAHGFTKGRADNNPVALDEAIALALLREIF